MFDIEIDLLSAELQRLAEFSDAPAPAVTRVLFTDAGPRGARLSRRTVLRGGACGSHRRRGEYLCALEGADPKAAGGGDGFAHRRDSVQRHVRRHGWRAGRAGGDSVAAVRAGVKPRRSIELVMLTSEEPTRFGYGCLGSRLLGGQLDPGEGGAADRRARQRAGGGAHGGGVHGLAGGCAAAARATTRSGLSCTSSRGRCLERTGLPIGVVTAIAAPATLRVRYQGPGGHAGGVYMPDRKDPLLAAAKLALEVEAAALELGGGRNASAPSACSTCTRGRLTAFHAT